MPTYLGFLIPQIPKMCHPIKVTLMKIQPYYSQSNVETTENVL